MSQRDYSSDSREDGEEKKLVSMSYEHPMPCNRTEERGDQ